MNVNTIYQIQQICFAESVLHLLTQLYACDSKWPDIYLSIILSFIHSQDYLGGHPTMQGIQKRARYSSQSKANSAEK